MTNPRFTPGGGQDLMLPEDIMAEDESLGLYPLGPSFMPVTAAADWNSTGHSGMVETTKGVAGGTQIFADEEAEEAPTSYERRWFGSEWGAWAEAGGGGGIPDNIQPLEADSRDFNAEPDAYPVGISLMPAVDDSEEGMWGWEFDLGRVWTIRDGVSQYTIQIFIANGGALATRAFNGALWSDFDYLKIRTNHAIDALAESDGLSFWPSGSTVMPVTAGANWGPNSGEAGVVHTVQGFAPGLSGGQTLYTEAGVYSRHWTGSAWSSWV